MISVEVGPWTISAEDDGEGLTLTYDDPECPPTNETSEDGKEAVRVVLKLAEDPELDELFKALKAWNVLRSLGT